MGHEREDFFCDAVHVPVGALEFEGWLCAVGIFLGSALNVLEVDGEDGVSNGVEVAHGFDKFLDLGRGVVRLEVDTFLAVACGDLHDGVNVFLAAGGEFAEDGV